MKRAFFMGLLMAALSGGASQALPTSFGLGGTFAAGGTLSGTFTVNVYGVLASFDVTTTPDAGGTGFHYVAGDPNDLDATGTLLVFSRPGYNGALVLKFATPLTSSPAVDPLVLAQSFECGTYLSVAGACTGTERLLVAGAAFVPEPASLALGLAGLAATGLVRRRRR